MGDCENFRTKSVCPHKREVTESSNSDDTDLLPRTASKTDERGVSSQTSTQHRSCDGGIEVLRNLEHEILLYADVRGKASLRNSTIFVFGTVGVDSGISCQTLDRLIIAFILTG